MSNRPHLWMTLREADSSGPVRFFLVPRGIRLPAGELKVRNMQLGTQLVSEEALADFEVDAEAAQAHIDAGWSSFVGRVQAAWNDLLGREGSSGPPDLKAWLGVTPGQVLTDEEKRREGGRSLLSRAGSLFGQDLDEEQLDKVEEEVRNLRQTISREGGRLAENLEKAADSAVDAIRKNLGGGGGAGGGPSSSSDPDREEPS